MACNMADTFTSLGGKILYRTPALGVEKTDSGWAVRTAAGTMDADAVIISADARTAIDSLFPEPLTDRWARRMRKGLETTQCMFIGLGIKASLQDWPRSMQIVLRKPFQAAGLSFGTLVVNNYSREADYAPEGCSTLTCLLHGPSYEFWKQARQDGRYKQEKQAVVERFIEALGEVIPEIRGNVEVTDMATPLTYERYCDTFEGSYMTDWLPGRSACTAPIRYRKGIYFTGQRTSFSGGLPIAAETGRRCAQKLCKDFALEFVSRD
jgi:phytoene dehydrogenase-like protein